MFFPFFFSSFLFLAPEAPEDFKNFLLFIEEEDLEVEDFEGEDLEGEDFVEGDLIGKGDLLGEDLVDEDLVDEDLEGDDLVDEDLIGEDRIDEDLEGDDNLLLLFEDENADFLLEFCFITKLLFSLISLSES